LGKIKVDVSELKHILQKLKEDIQYRYCVYRLKKSEGRKSKSVIDNYNCSSSDDESINQGELLKINKNQESVNILNASPQILNSGEDSRLLSGYSESSIDSEKEFNNYQSKNII
jgi:hypothetical protein